MKACSTCDLKEENDLLEDLEGLTCDVCSRTLITCSLCSIDLWAGDEFQNLNICPDCIQAFGTRENVYKLIDWGETSDGWSWSKVKFLGFLLKEIRQRS